jgi:hypothetical protein
MKDGVKILASGQTRYYAWYVKESGKPYSAKSFTYNNYQKNPGYLTWDGCIYNGVTVPTNDEEPIQFRYLQAIGANHYEAEYDRTEEMKPILEKRRRQKVISNTVAYENRKKFGYINSYNFDWKKHWKEVVELVKIEISGDKKEVEKFKLFGMDIHKHYDIYSEKEQETKGQFVKTLEVATKIVVAAYEMPVAGVTYEGRQEYIARMTKDTQIYMVREQENEYDENAVAVHAILEDSNPKIGFIPREYASQIAPKMDSGEKVYLELINIGKETHGRDNWETEEYEEWEQWVVYIRLAYEEESMYATS